MTNDTVFSNDERQIWGISMLVIAIIGLLLYCIACFLNLAVKEFRNAFGYLCLSDGICGIAIMVQFIGYTCPVTMLMYPQPPSYLWIIAITNFNMTYLYYVSMYAHSFASINRFLAICKPLLYRKIDSTRFVSGLLICTWVIPFIQTSPYFFGDCSFYFDNTLLQWTFTDNPCGQNFSFYIDFLYNCILMLFIFAIDCYTLFVLRKTLYRGKLNNIIR
uniref:G-protein coupled receptors family 1 profile domain-containing protein n=1 Tax=Acrobeloides nanus TaxID=290746 RepID=A0A914DLZ8_9BILA